jgi:hypothetical protein
MTDDDGALCTNTCNTTWSVRVCDENFLTSTSLVCLRWGPVQVVAAVIFLLLTITTGVAALALSSIDGSKAAQWITAFGSLVCFSITVSYSTTSSVASYDRHMGTMLTIAVVLAVGWLLWTAWAMVHRARARRRRGQIDLAYAKFERGGHVQQASGAYTGGGSDSNVW